MKRLPSISVVVAAYQNAAFIKQTLDSMLAQTRPAAEIIVINDGSTDDTREIVAPYRDRVTYIEQDNRGFVRTMNRGTDLATGDYLLQFSSDDWLLPDALETLGGVLDQHPRVGLAYGNVRYVDGRGLPIHGQRWVRFPVGEHREVESLIAGNYVPAIAVLLRRKAVDDAGTHMSEVDLFHDWGLWLAMVLTGWRMYGVDRAVTCYRRHARSLTAVATRRSALTSRLAVATRLVQQFDKTLTASERRAFGALKRQLRRKLGLVELETGDRRQARRRLRELLVSHRDPRAAVGLALTWIPDAVVSALARATGPVAVWLKGRL